MKMPTGHQTDKQIKIDPHIYFTNTHFNLTL